MIDAFHPRSTSDVRDCVRWANAENKSLEIVGGGTKRNIGQRIQADQLVSLRAISGITNYEPEELVMTAKAGTPLCEIEKALSEHGQMLAFEPPEWTTLLGGTEGKATIGGVLACNLSGPRRPKSGAARDHFLGVEAVSGRGEIFKAGGRVVKNVTGYDMCKLLAGSYGTLGIMTEVTLKVLPAPEHETTVIVAGLSMADGCKAMTKLLQTPLEISGAVHLPKSVSGSFDQLAEGLTNQALTAFRLEGPEPSVRARLKKAEKHLSAVGPVHPIDSERSSRFWFNIRELRCFDPEETSLLMRMTLAPGQAGALATEVEQIPDSILFVDWGGGLIWVGLGECSPSDIDNLRQLCRKRGGNTTLVKAPEKVRQTHGIFEPLPNALHNLNARVKANFDPHDVLNPGKMGKAL